MTGILLPYDDKARLVITCGPPASGKTTFAQWLRRENPFAVVCPDAIRLALHGQQFVASAEDFIWATAELMVRALLRTEQWVIVDATNTSRKRRARWSRIAQEFEQKLDTFVLDTPLEICKERNASRGFPVPDEVIERMFRQWEPPDSEEESIRVSTIKGY